MGERGVRISIVCDVMANLEGSARPAICLAEGLKERGWDVSLVSPAMLGDVEEELSSMGITPVNLGARLFSKDADPSLLWIEGWSREAFLGLNSRLAGKDETLSLNFSHMVSVPSLAWYLQGPPSKALEDISCELPWYLSLAHRVVKPLLRWADGRLIRVMSSSSRLVVANSRFCASMYSGWGLNIDHVIYPPINLQAFHPSPNPSSDYVLTYFGKETIYSVVKNIADGGVKIKAFGSKTQLLASSFKKRLLSHPNVEFLGRVTSKKLVELYSNALFTLFPFTHEPFGYIPLESMACGVPVLTFGFQGPGEYVVDGHTGWLTLTREEMVKRALEVWREGYPRQMSLNCVKEAAKFDERRYMERWMGLLEAILNSSPRRR
ncbi:MAG: glycosyltransferase [Candidatus Bathyarchaeia archaeon]